MTNEELEAKLKGAVDNERHSVREVLESIAEAENRRLYAIRGFPSMFKYLTSGLGYPEDGAYRRLSAARLVRTVPDALAKLEDGRLNLSSMSRLYYAFRTQKKIKLQGISPAEKANIIAAVENKTLREVDQILRERIPELAHSSPRERAKCIDDETTRLSINLSAKGLAALEAARDILSHALPGAPNGQIIERVLKDFAACSKLGQRTKGQSCEYIDEDTNRRCGSTFMLQRDHVIPRALGGSNDPSNLRWLCKPHNLLEAENKLGKEWANAWRA